MTEGCRRLLADKSCLLETYCLVVTDSLRVFYVCSMFTFTPSCRGV